MSKHYDREKDEAVLELLARGVPITRVSEETGVSARTIHRRLRQHHFSQRLCQLRSDVMQSLSAELMNSGSAGLRTLLELQQGDAKSPVRLGAAKALLHNAMKAYDLAELEVRLGRLEEFLEQTASGRGAKSRKR